MTPAPESPLATLTRNLAMASTPAANDPPLAPLSQMALARGRVHEITGPARRTLAALVAGAAQAEGPVLWLRASWRAEDLCPRGLASLIPDPGALIIARCKTPTDILWGTEEALRAGCVALVVAEVASPPDLRQVRRLHLAAADGLARNRLSGRDNTPAPLGLLSALDLADSRIPGIESRWALHPLPPEGNDAPRWRLDRLLARGLPPRDWTLSALPDTRPPEAAEI